MTADKLDALAHKLGVLHVDLRAMGETATGRFDAVDRKLDTIDGRIVGHRHLLAEIVRRLPAE